MRIGFGWLSIRGSTQSLLTAGSLGAPLAIAAVVVALAQYAPAITEHAPGSGEPAVERNDASVRVTGTVWLGEKPASEVNVEFFSAVGETRAGSVKTDAAGRFSVGLQEPAGYAVAVAALATLPSTYREFTFPAGENVVDIRLPATSLVVQLLDERGDPLSERDARTVQLLIRGPRAPTSSHSAGFVGLESHYKGRYVGLGYGDYSVSAFTSTGLVSSDIGRVDLSEPEPDGRLQLRLVRRPLALRVQDTDGRPIRGARVASMLQRSATEQRWPIPINSVPPGELIEVSAPGFLPICVVAQRIGGVQVVEVHPLGAGAARITLVDGPGRPVGILYGLPGSQCPVAIGAMRVEEIGGMEQPQRNTFEILGLPTGTYQYRAQVQAPSAQVRVPGPTVEYAVPAYCRFCG